MGIGAKHFFGIILVLCGLFGHADGRAQPSANTKVHAASEKYPTAQEILATECEPDKLEIGRCRSSDAIIAACGIVVLDRVHKVMQKGVPYFLVMVGADDSQCMGKDTDGALAVHRNDEGQLISVGFIEHLNLNDDYCIQVPLKPGYDEVVFCLLSAQGTGLFEQYLSRVQIAPDESIDQKDIDKDNHIHASDYSGAGGLYEIDCGSTAPETYFSFDELRIGSSPDTIEMKVKYATRSQIQKRCAKDGGKLLDFSGRKTCYAAMRPADARSAVYAYNYKNGLFARKRL